tara:strand:- start:567 stop:689 length:123 start_codon:yes stop_codon:yes gene_type:complete
MIFSELEAYCIIIEFNHLIHVGGSKISLEEKEFITEKSNF